MNWLVVRVSAHTTLFEFSQGHSVLVKVLFGSKGWLLDVDSFVIGCFNASLVAIHVRGLRQNVSKLIIALSSKRLQFNINSILQNNRMIDPLV